MQPAGILNLHKPSGMTSRRVVDIVQRLVRPAKAGHAGTLDPLASGVLVVCVGRATRLIEYVQRMPKHYLGVFLLGQHSDTEDIEGEVLALADPPLPSRADLDRAAVTLTGEILQRPPAFSALKVAGRRAYDLARAGQQVDLAPRPVTIHRLEVADYCYPRLTLDIACGGGTYVRSLGRDLAIQVGTQAVMAGLERRAVGCFTLDSATPPEMLTAETIARHLRPPREALAGMPSIVLDDGEIYKVGRGLAIGLPLERMPPAPAGVAASASAGKRAGEWAAIDARGRLVAILRALGENQFTAAKNFAADAG